MYISRTAACDDAFLYGCSCGVQRIFHTKLSFLHLCLGCSANTDNGYTACQLSQTLLQLLSVKIRGGFLDLLANLGYPCGNGILVAHAVNDDGVLFLNLNRFCTS